MKLNSLVLGFPAGDITVVQFLTAHGSTATPFRHAEAFLVALFKITHEYLENIDEYIGYRKGAPTTAQKFRILMTRGQDFVKQGRLRIDFFDKVIAYAKSVGGFSSYCFDVLFLFVHFQLVSGPGSPVSRCIYVANTLLINSF